MLSTKNSVLSAILYLTKKDKIVDEYVLYAGSINGYIRLREDDKRMCMFAHTKFVLLQRKQTQSCYDCFYENKLTCERLSCTIQSPHLAKNCDYFRSKNG